MNDQMDRKGMIESLTDGIGFHFGRASRRSYFQQLERLESQPMFRRANPDEKQFFVDVLACAAVFQTVIVPVRSSAQFVSVLREAGATHLRVAKDKLDSKHAAQAAAVSTGFRAMMQKMEIPEHLLHYPTFGEFLKIAHTFFHNQDR